MLYFFGIWDVKYSIGWGPPIDVCAPQFLTNFLEYSLLCTAIFEKTSVGPRGREKNLFQGVETPKTLPIFLRGSFILHLLLGLCWDEV